MRQVRGGVHQGNRVKHRIDVHVRRYPSWLAENAESLSAEEVTRYKAQYKTVCKLCKLFEGDGGDYKQVVDLMQEVSCADVCNAL